MVPAWQQMMRVSAKAGAEGRNGVANAVVISIGVLWGLYWVPAQQVGTLLPGGWGPLAITAVAGLLLLPLAVAKGRQATGWNAWTAVFDAVGGASLVLYSVGLLYGNVTTVILLFYLTPVWSTLIQKFGLREPVSWRRYVALAIGLGGLVLVLGRDQFPPSPLGTGEWMGLAAGVLFSVMSVGVRNRRPMYPANGALAFAVGAIVVEVIVIVAMPAGHTVAIAGPRPTPWMVVAWIVAAGVLWWSLSLMGLLWAATRIDPARLGLLLMGEVLVGVVSSVLLAAQSMTAWQIAGAACVVGSAVLEVASPDRS